MQQLATKEARQQIASALEAQKHQGEAIQPAYVDELSKADLQEQLRRGI